MARPEIGSIQHESLREIWPDEAGNFTPWLADNLAQLGTALGMDLEFVRREAPVGSLSLDILAKDVKTDNNVIIENQLEWSDNVHLGQILAYAAHFNARTIIWVSRKFHDVHHSAIHWLNQLTSDEIKIYGVEVRAIKIGDSLPAIEFHPVVFPQ